MYTVLIADDEEELRKAVIQKVDWESAGFTVVGEAENGAEAFGVDRTAWTRPSDHGHKNAVCFRH